MTIPKALQKVYGVADEVVWSDVLERLRHERFVDKAELIPGLDYYFLRPRAAEGLRVQKLEQNELGPVNGTAKVEKFGTLSFCCLEGIYRALIPKETFRKQFSSLYEPGPHIRYYTERHKLGYVRLDKKGMQPRRVLEKCWREVARRRRVEAFGRLIDEGRFVISIVTAEPERADRLEAEFLRQKQKYVQYHQSKAAKERGEFVEKNTFKEFLRYQRKGKPPLPPPLVEIKAVPGLRELMYG